MKRRARLLAVTVVAGVAGLSMAAWHWLGPPAAQRAERATAAVAPRLLATATPGPVDEVVRLVAPGHGPVIFVGLDAVDWDLLEPLMAAGSMPNLTRLVREGDRGQLETIHPPLSPLVWTSMMTGVNPVRHGVLDFIHLRPDTGDKEPITSSERKAPAIWNMATAAGKRSAVFGLWATYPAEPVNGLLVSDRMFTFLYSESAPPEGAVYPRDAEPWARDIEQRVKQEIGYDALKAYLPWLTRGEYASATSDADPYRHPVSGLRRILLETRIYHELATNWIRTRKPDLAIVYFQGTDSIGHVFAPFAPPKQRDVSAEDYAHYSGVPRQYFHRIDEMLGDYLRLAEANGAALLIASDHGFAWGEGRPTTLSSFANATAARWHRPQGMYLLWRPGIRQAASARGQASVMQVCGTLMALLGLPQGSGLESPPILPVSFASTATVDYGRFFAPSAPPVETRRAKSASDDQDRIAQLRALGYIGSAEPARVTPLGTGAERTRSAGSYNNEGLVLVNQGRIDAAIAAYEKALALEPQLASALWNLSDLLYSHGRDLDRADDLLLRALTGGLTDAPKYVIGRAIGYQRTGHLDRSIKLLEPATRVRPDEPDFWLFSGRYHVEQGDCVNAVEQFSRAIALAPDRAAAYSARALARVCAGDRDGARADLRHAIVLDPSDDKARTLLRELSR